MSLDPLIWDPLIFGTMIFGTKSMTHAADANSRQEVSAAILVWMSPMRSAAVTPIATRV